MYRVFLEQKIFLAGVAFLTRGTKAGRAFIVAVLAGTFGFIVSLWTDLETLKGKFK